MRSLDSFIDVMLPAAILSEVESAFYRNDNQESSWE
jgi:hypothetical protein